MKFASDPEVVAETLAQRKSPWPPEPKDEVLALQPLMVDLPDKPYTEEERKTLPSQTTPLPPAFVKGLTDGAAKFYKVPVAPSVEAMRATGDWMPAAAGISACCQGVSCEVVVADRRRHQAAIAAVAPSVDANPDHGTIPVPRKIAIVFHSHECAERMQRLLCGSGIDTLFVGQNATGRQWDTILIACAVTQWGPADFLWHDLCLSTRLAPGGEMVVI